MERGQRKIAMRLKERAKAVTFLCLHFMTEPAKSDMRAKPFAPQFDPGLMGRDTNLVTQCHQGSVSLDPDENQPGCAPVEYVHT